MSGNLLIEALVEMKEEIKKLNKLQEITNEKLERLKENTKKDV